MESGFKTCPMCTKHWPDREAFLSDRQVVLCGYQVDFEDLTEGLFLFTHKSCGTTFSFPVKAFRDLRTGPVFAARRTGTEDCPGHCLRSGDLEPCPAQCECAWVRDVMQILRRRSRPAAR